LELKDFTENERENSSKFDSNVQKLNQELKFENSEREAKIKESLGLLVDKLSFVQGELYSERKNREEAYDGLIKRIGNEILRVNKLINQERKSREDSHNELMKMLSDTYQRYMIDVDVF
jgi:hypothetical protein